MKKILVPTDFSETSKNAAAYAVQLASDLESSTVILFHVFELITAGVDGSILTETEEDRQKVLTLAFNNLRSDLGELSTVSVESYAEQGGSLVGSVERFVRERGADMVIMGITGASKIEQAFIGSNAVNIAREGICPVIIVPPDAKYKRIENVLLAADFKNVQSTVPVATIRSVLDAFKPLMHIVHAGDEKAIEEKAGFKSEKSWLEKSFEGYDPDFYFIRSNDFPEAISNFTADHTIDLIVTIPKEHSLLSGFFKASHTKRLAYHSHVPILAIHA